MTKALLSLLAAAILLSAGCATAQKAKTPSEKDLAGYLLVYFHDRLTVRYMAISPDGYSFTASTPTSLSSRPARSPSRKAFATRTSPAAPTAPFTFP